MAAQGPSPEAKQAEYNCPRCKDIGWLAVLSTGEVVPFDDMKTIGDRFTARECECEEKKRLERLFKSSRITDHFRSVGFKGFKVDGRPVCIKDARDAAVDYYNQFDDIRATKANSIALLGPPGTGKTHLLMAIANGLLKRTVAVHYFPWVEGFGELKDNLDELEKRMEILRKVDVLFLDDLFKGRTKPTEFQLEQLFGVVNYRYLECMPMLVSSERDFDTMFEIDEALGRRIYERSKGHRVVMGLTDEERAAGMELNFSLLE